jgi:hypothetical protein
MVDEHKPLTDEEKWQLLTSHEKLGEVLLKRQMLTLAQIGELVHLQEKTGKAFGELIVSQGFLTRAQVLQALEWQHQSDKVEMQSIMDLQEKRKKTNQ